MDQYRPAGRVSRGGFPELDRRPTATEYAAALEAVLDEGLHRLDRRLGMRRRHR